MWVDIIPLCGKMGIQITHYIRFYMYSRVIIVFNRLPSWAQDVVADHFISLVGLGKANIHKDTTSVVINGRELLREPVDLFCDTWKDEIMFTTLED